MWHTLVDDPTSYVEASATCGFAYGILRAVDLGIVDKSCANSAMKALAPILKCVSEEGKVEQVSTEHRWEERARISISRSRLFLCRMDRHWQFCSSWKH